MFICFIAGHNSIVAKINKSSKERKYVIPKIIIPICLWLIYIIVLSVTGILRDYNLPPRFPLLVFLPFFILTAIFFIKQKNNSFFAEIPLQWTTFYQSFRIIVELMLLYTFYKGFIPIEATFEGFNFDIVMGITAIILGFTLARNVQKYKNILLLWNIIGILMVLVVGVIIGTSIYFPELWGHQTPTVSFEFVSFPYLLIPGFLAPSAIFIHVISILQIMNKTK